MGHARSILGLEDISSQLMVLGEIMSKKLSVRETERLVSKYLEKDPAGKNQRSTTKGAASSDKKSAEINQIEQQLRSLLGVKVALQYDKGNGVIRIPFRSDKELNEILDLLEGIDMKQE
jgi:ParB family chromosome partitioning protein